VSIHGYLCSFSACSRIVLVNNNKNRLNPFDPFYPNNVRCIWRIKAPKHQIIKFSVTKFDLAQPGDYLEIQEEKNIAAYVIDGNFTTKTDRNRKKWTSSGNNLWVKFASDNDNVAEGFVLEWRFVNKSKGIHDLSNII